MGFKKMMLMGFMLAMFTQVYNVSAYTPHENGGNRVTASGELAVEGRTIAADCLPMGTRVIINGHEYTVCDRFGGGYTNRIDIFMEDYDRAIEFGRQQLTCHVIYPE